jgi:release factor glutamine methyltransferase
MWPLITALALAVRWSRASRFPKKMAEPGGLVSALNIAAEKLAGISDTPRLDAELLMAHALGIGRGKMLLNARDLVATPAFAALLTRRLSNEPVAYITGWQAFWTLDLIVSPAVLIPRGDSETLIEAALAHFAGKAPPKRIADLGTGSGALLFAALCEFAEARGVGIDASAAALGVARANAERLQLQDRAALHQRDWRRHGWSDDLDAPFDLILCNPPYVESDADLQPSVRDFEPASALYSGAEGLEDYRLLIPQIPALLSGKGIAIFELGQGQAAAVSDLAANAGLYSQIRRDLQGIERALLLTKTA